MTPSPLIQFLRRKESFCVMLSILSSRSSSAQRSPEDTLTSRLSMTCSCSGYYSRPSSIFTLHILTQLMFRFPYRLTPRLPPAKLMANIVGVSSDFIDDRRKSLIRWLTIITSHPVFREDSMVRWVNYNGHITLVIQVIILL